MLRTIPVSADGTVIYEIILTRTFEALPEKLKELGYRQDQKICIVTDTNVSALYAEKVQSLLRTSFQNVMVHTFEAGENNKNLETVNKLYEHLITSHFDRNDVLVALGGGVVGDLTGFAAATYLRGIDFIQIPTTLLAQVDSSIGGKTGVDFLQYKNMVGAFHQPKLVYMNLEVLNTLPQKQLISGMGEILKNSLIKDAAYFSWLNAHHDDIAQLVPDIMEEMIYQSCNIKKEVVECDPNEYGERALLNFGHTIGHAIEKLSDFSLCHGECVGLGMAAASYISWKLGYITNEDFCAIEKSLLYFGLSVKAEGFSCEDVLKTTKSDKKMVGRQVKFILLSSIGNAHIYKDLTDDQILDGIRHVCG